MHRNKTLYIDSIKEIEYCGSKMLYLTGGEFEFPFKVNPTKTEHNLDNCEPCNNHHKLLIKEFSERVNSFPNCCKFHSNVVKIPEFALGNYGDVAEWSADKVMFSFHHFRENINNSNWYNEIVSYFEYCIESYGSFPVECGEPLMFGNYFNCLLHLMKNSQDEMYTGEITKKELKGRIDRIINYLESYRNGKEEDSKKDFNLLLSKYNEWFKIFPWELPYFRELKSNFSKKMPIFSGSRYNKYLGTTTRKLTSIEDLVEQLISTTKKLLNEINGLVLYEKNELKNADEVGINLILENRRLSLKEMTLKSNTSTSIYIKTIKFWLKEEKQFIEDIKPYLKNITIASEKPKPEFSIKQIALKLVYEGVMVTRENATTLIKPYGHNSGDKLYNEFTFYSSSTNRKASPTPFTKQKFKNKIDLFHSVSNILTEPNKSRLLDELKIMEINYKNEFE